MPDDQFNDGEPHRRPVRSRTPENQLVEEVRIYSETGNPIGWLAVSHPWGPPARPWWLDPFKVSIRTS